MMRRWVIILLLFINALLLGWLGWVTSPNRTEVGHIGATVYFCKTLRFDVFHVNPPLTRMVSALPVALTRPHYDWEYYSSRPQDRCEGALGRAFIAANAPQKARWCFVLARWSLAPLLLLGGYLGYRLSREIYGDAAAPVFLTLWCFSPLLLAWGATICPDAVAAVLGLVAVYSFRQWLRAPNWVGATVAGLCLGLLPLAKTTWVIAFGIWPLIWCIWAAASCLRRCPEDAGVPPSGGRWPQRLPGVRAKAGTPTSGTRVSRHALRRGDQRSVQPPPFRQLSLVLFIGLYTLNMGYFFDGTCRPLGQYVFISQSLRGGKVGEEPQWPAVTGNRFAGTWLAGIPVPLPAEFVQGIDTQRYDFERGRHSYLGGTWADHGWWYYYVYVLGVKMPLGTWCLVFLAVLATLARRSYNASWRDEMVLLVPLVTIFIFVSSQTGFSENPRYILPALPLLFVWISKVGRAFAFRHRFVATLATPALVWLIASSLWVYPHSLSYFHELAGGPRDGPRHLLGSSVDWGQELFALDEWYQRHPEARPMRMACTGLCPLELTKIESAGRPPIGPDGSLPRADPSQAGLGPQPGWYALSVNEIYDQSGQWRYFLEFEPEATAGYAIYIYHVTLDEANRVRRELGLPELSEDGQQTEDGAARGRT